MSGTVFSEAMANYRICLRGGGRGIDWDVDTITESCKGAINFMVIALEIVASQELPVVDYDVGACGMRRSNPKGVYHKMAGYFVFWIENVVVDQLRVCEAVPPLLYRNAALSPDGNRPI